MPVYENFTDNNIISIRGFRPNIIGPKTTYEISENDTCIGYKKEGLCKSLHSIGGNAMIMSNLELITPIPFINQEYSNLLRSSFFLDAGGIWDTTLNNLSTMKSVKLMNHSYINNIYASTGLSLKWISPIGPLVFSYSYPFQNNKSYQIEPFQLNFGKNW